MRKIVSLIIALSLLLVTTESNAGIGRKVIAGLFVAGSIALFKKPKHVEKIADFVELDRKYVKLIKESKVRRAMFEEYRDIFFAIGASLYAIKVRESCDSGAPIGSCKQAINYAYMAMNYYKGKDDIMTKVICSVNEDISADYFFNLRTELDREHSKTINLNPEEEENFQKLMNDAQLQLEAHASRSTHTGWVHNRCKSPKS